MLSTYSRLAKLERKIPGLRAAPAKGTADGSVSFVYIEGTSGERLLINSILENNTKGSITVINKLITLIDSLPSVRCDPCDDPQFTKIFGSSYKGEADCTRFGLVDFNLDNIIEDSGGQWHLIDYEWAFDFPIPKDFLIQRFFYWFFIKRYQSILRYHADRIPQVLIAPDIALPDYIHSEFKEYLNDLGRVVESESHFQTYVVGRRPPSETIDFFGINNKKARASVQAGYLTEILSDMNCLKSQSEQLQAELSEATRSNNQLRIELQNIHASRAYKAAKKIAGVRNGITGKLKGRRKIQ